GQSNMEMAVGDVGPGYRGVKDWQKEVAAANYGGIRLFTVENEVAAAPRDNCKGSWVACTPEHAKAFSAAAYFFGRELHKTLNVPVGLIDADWGGTVCEAWTSELMLERFPEFRADLDFVRALRNEPTNASTPTPQQGAASWWEQAAAKDAGS